MNAKVPQQSNQVESPAQPSSRSGDRPTLKSQSISKSADPRSALFQSLTFATRIALGHAVELARRSGQTTVHMEHLLLALYLHSAATIRKQFDEAGVQEADLVRVLQRINPGLTRDAALMPVDFV